MPEDYQNHLMGQRIPRLRRGALSPTGSCHVVLRASFDSVFQVNGHEESLFRTQLSHICVHVEGFGDNSTRDDLSLSQFIKKWTPPCLRGYFPAKTSFGVWKERDYIYTIDIAPFLDTPVAPFPPLSENEIKPFDDGARYK